MLRFLKDVIKTRQTFVGTFLGLTCLTNDDGFHLHQNVHQFRQGVQKYKVEPQFRLLSLKTTPRPDPIIIDVRKQVRDLSYTVLYYHEIYTEGFNRWKNSRKTKQKLKF